MKQKIIFFLCIAFVFVKPVFATKIITASDNDWDNTQSWNSGQVPSNPDTILIRHYITMSHDLTITAPTVLIIEDGGTLCGDYLLDVSCGAGILNYGHLYLNSAIIRDGSNYNEFFAKASVILEGCSFPTNGFSNVSPNGHMSVWPPVLCKTSGTNWKGATGIPGTSPDEIRVSISPNPINSGYVSVSVRGDFQLSLYDTQGRLLQTSYAANNGIIDLHGYSNGFYFVAVTSGNKQVFKKILVDQ